MISHVVLMTPRAGLPVEDRDALIAAFETAVRVVPSVRGVRCGRRVVHGAAYEDSLRADYLIIIEFDDVAGLQAYLQHPAHGALGDRFARSLGSAFICDFELSGLDGLSGG